MRLNFISNYILILYTIYNYGLRGYHISLSITAVPAMIFYALLPTIPKVSFINTVSLVAEENKQNYSTFGYIGGGLAKKSTYMTGNASNYSSV